MADRMTRFLDMIGGESALPRKLTPPPEQPPRPPTPPASHTEYDSEEYKNLPHPNTPYVFGDIESALPRTRQATPSRFDSPAFGGNVPFDSKKGQALPADTRLSPFIAVTKYCYNFSPKQWMQPLATAFFDQGKIFTRDWDIYYISTHSHGLHTFVPTSQLQSLLDEINSAFPDANIVIDEWQRDNGFSLDFSVLPQHLQPRFLGRCNSRPTYDSWVEQLQSEPNMVLSTVPTEGDRSFAAFKSRLDAAAALNKAKQKANRAKKHAETLVARQDIARQAVRGQQYFGLRPKSDKDSLLSEAPATINASNPVPYAFDQEPILIAIDLEAYERPPHMITEVGLATLDVRELKGVAPGENGKNWHKFIRGRHIRVLEWKDYKNSEFVQGCPAAFQFGTSEFVSKKSVAAVLASCFEEPFSGPPSMEHEFPPLGPSDQTKPAEQRNIIVVGHDLKQDVSYCEEIGFYIFNRPNIIDHLDTMALDKQYMRQPNGRSLGNILAEFDLTGWFLHNAGNDAMYTMQALLGICVKAASEEGTEAEAKKVEGIEKKIEASVEIATERAIEDATGWDFVGDDAGLAKKPTQYDFRAQPKENKARSAGGLYTVGGAPLDV